VVHDTIVTQMPRTVPISAQVAFGYAQKSTLPPFVINYFMSIQPAVPRVTNVTRFFCALHMIERYREHYFDMHPEASGPAINLPPPRQLLEAALNSFYASVAASLDYMSNTGTFNLVSIDQARVFLDEMREAVRNSTASSEEREMFQNVQERYDRVMAEENARRSGEHQPLKSEASKITTDDTKDKQEEDLDKTVDLTSPDSKSPESQSPPQDPPADADA